MGSQVFTDAVVKFGCYRGISMIFYMFLEGCGIFGAKPSRDQDVKSMMHSWSTEWAAGL
jgi:hypothetical protein